MKSLNIISDIFDLNKDINLAYRLSNAPKFIRKIIANRRRKKVYEYINVLKDKPISFYVLYEFCNILRDTYPPFGKYRSVVKFIKDPDIATIAVSVDDKDYYLMMINFTESEFGEINISYTHMVNGKAVLVYREKPYANDLLEENKDITIEDLSLTNTEAEKRQIMKNRCVKTIHDDLITFIEFRVAESERIFES